MATHYDPVSGRPAPDPSEASSRKLAAGITGILLGTFGVHKFILGYNTAGIIMLLLGLSCVGTIVSQVIGVIEGIIYLTKSDQDFYRTYMVGKKEWF